MTDVSIWETISNWAQSSKVPAWQSDAFRRIYEKRELSQMDIHELGALLRSEFNVPINSDKLGSLKAERFSLGGQSDAELTPISAPTVQLVSMSKLTNVNAIISDKPLKFCPRGLTIVFGYNGSGKTGYCRVLKRACYARDSHASNEGDAILPDIRIHDENERPANEATAEFMLKVDDNDRPIIWDGKKRIAEYLNLPNSPIAVFDSSAADVYIIGNNEVPFRPYGLDIMVELAKVCDILQESVSQDIRVARQELKEWWDFPWEMSASAETKNFVSRIKNQNLNLEKLDVAMAQKISDSFSEKKRGRLEYLNKIFEEQDPVKRAKSLRDEIEQIVQWKKEVAGLAKSIGSDIPRRLRESIEDFQEADKIAHKKMDDFQFEVRISKSGSSLWNDLFTAAEKFTQEIDPNEKFPNVKECVLCQQPMPEENKKMLSTLKKFVREGAGKVRDDKKAEVKEIIDSLENISPAHPLNKFPIKAIERIAFEISPDVGRNFSKFNQEVQDFIDELVQTKKDLLDMAKRLALQASLQLPKNSPIEKIAAFCLLAEKMAVDLENSGHLRPERNELESVSVFARHFDSIVNYINLRCCFQGTDSTAISKKTRELSQKPLNDKLTDALKSEIKALGMFGEVAQKFLTKSQQTKAKQKASMQYQAKDDGTISGKILKKILSEGEQRTIALASFFAEISLSPKSVSSIVLDDPISSLDHERIDYFVKRLRKEAKNRQVIVFTHDLYFANLFKEKEAHKIAVWRHEDNDGFVSYGRVAPMPFEGRTIGTQIAELKNAVPNIGNLDSDEQQIELREKYKILYIAVEHLVEACLLQNMISRRVPDIKVGCISSVFAHPDKKKEIADDVQELYDRAAKAKLRHKQAREMSGSRMSFHQFKKDVEKLDEIRKALAQCKAEN